MKIRHNHMLYLPTTIMLFTLWVIKPVAASTTNSNTGVSSGGSSFNSGRRKKSGGGDSILEMMDSKKIEKFFEDKRLNMSLGTRSAILNENNPIIIENDLNEDFIENSSSSPSLFSHHQHNQNHRMRQHGGGGNGGNNSGRIDRYKVHNRRRQHLIERHQDDFDYESLDTTLNNNQRKKQHTTESLQMDQLLPYNDSLLPADSTVSLDTIDSKQFSVDQLLKTSNDGLYLTKKEFLQKDWCKTEPLIQRIREAGCISRPFVNHFCYGQCNSFFIPKEPKETKKRKHNRRKHGNRHGNHHNNGGNSNNNNGMSTINSNNGSANVLPVGYFEDEDLTIPQFESCGFCKPKKYIWVTITLRCPSMVPHIRKKRIQKIKRCSCMAMPMEKY